MGIIIPSGYGQARFVFQLAGKAGTFVWTCGYDAAVTGPAAAAATLRTIFAASSRPFHSAYLLNTYTFRGVECTEEHGLGPITGASFSSITGIGTGAPMPPNCAVLLTKRTNRGGRKGRGRGFLPPMFFGEAQVDSLGIINPGDITPAQTAWNAALTDWNASGIPPVLLHSDATAPDPITAFELGGQIATQRRRLR